jgi:hypothetical protein
MYSDLEGSKSGVQGEKQGNLEHTVEQNVALLNVGFP